MFVLKGLIEILLWFTKPFSMEVSMGKAEVVAAAKAQFVADQDQASQKYGETVYDGAFAEGVASVPVVVGQDPDEQAKIDAAVAQAVAPLNAQISDLQAKVAQDASDLEQVKTTDKAAYDLAMADAQSKLDDLSSRFQALGDAKKIEDGVVSALQAVADQAQVALDNLRKLIIPQA